VSGLLNLLAFDLGASNGRAVSGKFDGEKIALCEIHRFKNKPVKIRGNLYWNILVLFEEIKKGLKLANEELPNGFSSVAIDTWGVDYALIDKKGCMLGNPYCYRDERTEGLLEKALENMSREEIYKLTGVQFMRINTLIQLYADKINRPWYLDAADRILFTPDLLNFFLTGEKINEQTIASTSQIFNPQTRDWAVEILNKLNLPANIFGEITRLANEIGEVLPEIKEECGLNSNISVVAGGSHDTASAVAATPLEENSVFISSGTWSLLGMELDKPQISKNSLNSNFTNEMGLGNKIRFLKNISGLWLIQECKRKWEELDRNYSYEKITFGARKAKPFWFFLNPNNPKFIKPQNMPKSIQEYCRQTQQNIPEKPFQIARGIYESLALNYKHEIDKIEKITKKKVDQINMVGGGVKAEILCQFTADATQRRVVTGPVEATAMGNIISQLMAYNEIEDLKQGREIVRNSVELKEFIPQNKYDWNKAYEDYLNLIQKED